MPFPVNVPVQVVKAVELNALEPSSLVPTTLEPFIITAVASEDWLAKPVRLIVEPIIFVSTSKLFTKV